MVPDDIMKLWQTREDLDPELAPHVHGGHLKHPLYFQIFYHEALNAFINAGFRQKKQMVAEARANKNWGKYLVLHERPHRFEALAGVAADMTDEEYWEQLRWVWTDSENIFQYQPLLSMFLGRPGRERMMDEDDRAFYDRLPDKIAVYRGHLGRNRRGFSWTVCHWKAGWFAGRFGVGGSVTRGVVDKKNVIAALTSRGEWEIVADPRHVKGMKRVAVDRPDWLGKLHAECSRRYALSPHSYHGPRHWLKVEMNAIALARATPGADLAVARTFAVIHDSRRENEDDDPDHGARAAAQARKWRRRLKLNNDQMELLCYACERHDKGETTDNPTVGVCWDADRLDLTRVGTRPDEKYFSTKAAARLMWSI